MGKKLLPEVCWIRDQAVASSNRPPRPLGIPSNGKLTAKPKTSPSQTMSMLCGKQKNPHFGQCRSRFSIFITDIFDDYHHPSSHHNC